MGKRNSKTVYGRRVLHTPAGLRMLRSRRREAWYRLLMSMPNRTMQRLAASLLVASVAVDLDESERT